MALSIEHPLRFLLFPGGQEFTVSVPVSNTFLQVKQRLIASWPSVVTHDFAISLPVQLRLIFSGKVLDDSTIVEDLLRTCSDVSSPVTVHLVARALTEQERIIHAEANPDPHNNTETKTACTCGREHATYNEDTEQEEWQPDWGKGIHFHGCTFNEEELSQLRTVFSKRADHTNTIAFTDVHAFLRSYWKWMRANKHKEEQEEFPMRVLMQVKHRVLGGSEQRASFDHFLRIFFLFDNNTPADTCPHGEKPRVMRATEELHKSLKPSTNFDQAMFDNVFTSIDGDKDNVLTCQELELLFYVYSARLCW